MIDTCRKPVKTGAFAPRRRSTVIIPLLMASLWLTSPAGAQQSAGPSPEVEALHREIQQLKAGQREILKRLDTLQKAVERGAPRRRGNEPFKGAEVSIDGAATKGSAEARLVLIEFSDYQCPYCRRFSKDTLPQILENYVEPGKLRYVFRDFPLEQIHPAAKGAAIAARCAGTQDKYWEMHDRFFADQKSLQDQRWKEHAQALGLDVASFDACMAEEDHAQAVSRSIAAGRRVGVTGTPAFFLGTLMADGQTVKATEMIRGARPFADFKKSIEGLLANNKSD